jgi:signal transduction histidine kinase
MNQRARARLGPVDSLFSSLPTQHLADASRLLGSNGDTRSLLSTLQSADRPVRVPVQLVRLLALEDRVILSAEVRGRSSDELPPQQEILRVLLELQSKAMRHYFRLAELEESLSNLCRRPRSMGVVVSQALEMERTRIGRELHSGVGQNLAGIKVHLELIANHMPDPPGAVRHSLNNIQKLTDLALSEIRSVSQRLHPPDWARMSLHQAVEWLWVTTGIPDKFHATIEIHPLESDLPDAVRFAMYRAVQEGLANVVRHSGATDVKLDMGQRDDEVYMVLEDNGKGFNKEEILNGKVNPAVRGIGLRAMRDEVLGLGGRFDIHSTPGATKVEIVFPISENR